MVISEWEIENIQCNISNYLYKDNFEATKQLVALFDRIAKRRLCTWKDYVNMYDDNFYTYCTWEELVRSEVEQNYGLTEEECKNELDKTIWRLPCGWYVQYV